MEVPSAYSSLSRIDTSNDWSEMESLEGDNSFSTSRFFLSETNRSIEVIPSTPNKKERLSFQSDGAVATPGAIGSLTTAVVASGGVSSSPESIVEVDDEPLSSLVISVTNLDLDGTPTDDWESTLLPDKDAFEDVDVACTSLPINKHNCTMNGQVDPDHFTDVANKKPIFRPRPTISLFDKENQHYHVSKQVRSGNNNNNMLPPLRRHRRMSGHRRGSFHHLPSPKDLEVEGDAAAAVDVMTFDHAANEEEPSTTTTTTTTTTEQKQQPEKPIRKTQSCRRRVVPRY